MKTHILLLSAAYLNGGAYVDAGATVPLGDEKHEITEERAEDIVKGGRAELVDVETDEGDSEAGEGGNGAGGQAAPTTRRRTRG